VQRHIDERTSMSILGAPGSDQRSDAARALGGDSETPALEAPQTGLELGAGLETNQTMVPPARETVAELARPGRAGTIECPNCHAQAPADARFCPNCGHPLQRQAGQ